MSALAVRRPWNSMLQPLIYMTTQVHVRSESEKDSSVGDKTLTRSVPTTSAPSMHDIIDTKSKTLKQQCKKTTTMCIHWRQWNWTSVQDAFYAFRPGNASCLLYRCRNYTDHKMETKKAQHTCSTEMTEAFKHSRVANAYLSQNLTKILFV